MNVWKILKPYLPDFLYIKLPKEKTIQIIRNVIEKLRDSEVPPHYLDPEFHGNYYTLKLAKIDKIYPIIHGKEIDLEEIAKNPKKFPEVLKITRSLYDYLKGKSLEEIIEENGWDKKVMEIFEEAKRDFGRYFKISIELRKIGLDLDELMRIFEKEKHKGVKEYLKKILEENWEKTYEHFKRKLRNWYSIWIRIENLKNFKYGKDIFQKNWERGIKYIEKGLGVKFESLIRLSKIITGKKEKMWHPILSVVTLRTLRNILSKKYVGIRCEYLKKIDKILGDIYLPEIAIYNHSKKILINSMNIDYFWHLLGLIYKKLTVCAEGKNLSLIYGSPNKLKVLYLKFFLEKFGLNLEISETRPTMLGREYVIYLPTVLIYIVREFVKKSQNPYITKRFLSELISKKQNERYYISFSLKRYHSYGPIDRLLNIVGLSYTKSFYKRDKIVIYHIHSKSRSLAQEIYNMSIFRDIRRKI